MLFQLPLIKWAKNLTKNELELFVSTWIAPKWMKVDESYIGVLGFIKNDMYQTWADYFVKFLDAYKKEGLSFWGITTGNEPATSFFPTNQIPGVAWSPRLQVSSRNWLSHLSLHKDIRLEFS